MKATSSPVRLGLILLGSVALTTVALAKTASPPTAQAEDDIAWSIVSDLTTEIGPRQAGTEAEAAARKWALKRLTDMGFHNVREEPFQMPTWVRGEEQASLVGPFRAQKLAITALGNSASTGPRAWKATLPILPAMTRWSRHLQHR